MVSVTVRDSAGASAEIATIDHLLLAIGALGMVPTAAPTRARGLAESERITAQLLEEQNQGSVKVPPSTVIKSCGRHPDYHRCGESWSPEWWRRSSRSRTRAPSARERERELRPPARPRALDTRSRSQ